MNSLNFFVEPVLWTGSLYLIYTLVLKNTTLFQLSRIFLLGAMISGLIIPFITISQLDLPEKATAFIFPEIVITANSPAIQNSTEEIILTSKYMPLGWVYLFITIILSILFIIRIISIKRVIKKPVIQFIDKIKVGIIEGTGTVFTFLNRIYASKDATDHALLQHEMVHVKQRHFLDKIGAQLICIIQWFNPFCWIIRNELDSIHEFQADAHVIKQFNTDAFAYKKLLLERSLGTLHIALASNFNHSLIKKRIDMMKKQRSSILSGLRVLFVIPVIAGLAFFLACETKTSDDAESKIYSEVDVMAEYPGGIPAIRKFIATNLVYPKDALESGTTGKVFVQFTVNKKGKVDDVHIVRSDIDHEGEVIVVGYGEENSNLDKKGVSALEAEALRVMQGLSDFTPAQKAGKSVAVQYTFPIKFELQ